MRIELCPTDFTFLTNMSYGIWNKKYCSYDPVEYYQEFITVLQDAGYIVQVADPTDILGKYFSDPTYQHIAIFIKSSTERRLRTEEVWKIIDQARLEGKLKR